MYTNKIRTAPSALVSGPRILATASLALVLHLGLTSCANSPARQKASTVATADGSQDLDAVLKKHVQGDYLNYGALKSNAADMAQFERFLAWQATANVAAMTRDQAIAFYINAYNSCCIKAILDNYPVHSPKDVAGFFDKLKFTVAGERLTVSEIEYDRLIANYKDMRAHFAVVCADRGCLPIKNGAWNANTLDADLNGAARKFVNDPRHFKVDKAKKEVEISKIFEWYGPKFTKDPVRPAAKPELYLLPWLSGSTKQLLASGDYKLKTIEWDWTLNEQARR